MFVRSFSDLLNVCVLVGSVSCLALCCAVWVQYMLLVVTSIYLYVYVDEWL